MEFPPKTIRICFAREIYLQHREHFEVLKIKGCAWIVV